MMNINNNLTFTCTLQYKTIVIIKLLITKTKYHVTKQLVNI